MPGWEILSRTIREAMQQPQPTDTPVEVEADPYGPGTREGINPAVWRRLQRN